MGKLERAKIYVLDGDGRGDQKAEPTSGIDVCFNPKEYSLEKSVHWDTEKAFSDAPQPEFTKPAPMMLSVSLQFDTYEEGVSVREKYVRHLEKLSLMRKPLKKNPSPNDRKLASPPVVLFQWGRFTFKGVVTSLSQKYTMFLSDGTPVRAEVSLKLQNVWESDPDDPNHAPSVGSSSQKIVRVNEGDRLDSIAARELGDAGRWPEIAEANNVQDPARLSPGMALRIPE